MGAHTSMLFDANGSLRPMAIKVSASDLAPLYSVLERQARVFEIGNLPEQAALLRRLRAAIESAQVAT